MICRKTLSAACSTAILLLVASTLGAAIPAPEKLLPEDTLILVAAPDFAKLSDLSKTSPQNQLWNDPAMKPLKDKFLAKWDEDFVKPLEREMGIKLADYTSLLQGQLTLALTQDDWKGNDEGQPGFLLLVDAKDKSEQLKKNLTELRKKWVDSGKSLKTEKIRDIDFTVLALSSNDVPKTVRNLLPKSSESQEAAGDEKETKKAPGKNELVLGQADSLLILGNSTKAAEKIVAHVKGGSIPSLAEFAPYQANHLALFRDSPLYAWVNTKRLMDIFLPILSEKKENPDSPNPVDIKPEKILNAVGLTALKTIGFSVQQSSDGSLAQFFLGVPESTRQGLFKIIAGEPKEANPPPFVPADAVKFQRWRLDGRKAWATLEKTVSDISPQAASTLTFLLDSANSYAKDKDPSFDIRKNLIANLGDDIISYAKPPRGTAPADLASPPTVYLIGSPNPEQVAGALKSILAFMTQQSGASPQEREFLGRKINSMPISLPGRASSGKTPTLNYVASSGYLALSTDASAIEEYLRSSDSQAKPLAELSGLKDAAQKVTGPSSCLFGYQNDAENMRAVLEILKKAFGPDSSSSGLVPLAMVPGAEKLFKEWFDVSLLPPFDKISKYFSYTVYGGSATVDGLTLKMFTPIPPALKH